MTKSLEGRESRTLLVDGRGRPYSFGVTAPSDQRAATASPLHVEASGAGEAVALLHSSGLSGRQWRRLTSVLVARGLRVLVPDLTGHGASVEWPEPKPFSFRDDVAAIGA